MPYELGLEQDTGIEPAFTAWEAVVLPIYESCRTSNLLYRNTIKIGGTYGIFNMQILWLVYQ